MTDKIGVLGEATTSTVGTTTAYTVPSGKAAKCRLMYRIQAGSAASTTTFDIAVNGITVMSQAAMNVSTYLHSTKAQLNGTPVVTAPTGSTDATTVAPAPIDYYLSAADTVTYTIGTQAALAANVQVVGTEIDV